MSTNRITRICVDLLPLAEKAWFVTETWNFIPRFSAPVGDQLRKPLQNLMKAFRTARGKSLPERESYGKDPAFLQIRADGWCWCITTVTSCDGIHEEVLTHAYPSNVVVTVKPRLGRLFLDADEELTPTIEVVRSALFDYLQTSREAAQAAEVKKVPEAPEAPPAAPEQAVAVLEVEVPLVEPVPTKEPLSGAEVAERMAKDRPLGLPQDNSSQVGSKPFGSGPPATPAKVKRRGRPPGAKNRKQR